MRERTCFYESLLSQELPKRQKIRSKVCSDDFIMLKFTDYENLITYDYNLSQLKLINKYYKQKISGNKIQLLNRIYNYLKYSCAVLRIQKMWRTHLQRLYNESHGPAFFKRNLCVNECDFFTLENCRDITYQQFFSFKDESDFIYGFNLLSLYNLFIKNGNKTENPYNKKLLNITILDNLRKLIRFSKIMKISIEININSDEDVKNYKSFEMRVLSLFQFMDSLGNYTQTEWFTSLQKNSLIKFLREIYDIWSYRAQLDQNTKREICPPFGDPFRTINFNLLNNMTLNSLQKITLHLMEQLVKNGINNASKTLGAYYVLSSLTLVNENAAEAMPWLYESVAPL